MIKNVGKYFYRYIWGYRYDNEIINYFNDPYRNAIQTLYSDGYPVEKEYFRLIREYGMRYSPLNNEELEYIFIKNIVDEKINLDLELKYFESKREIIQNKSFILLNHTKYYGLETDYKNQIKTLSIHSEILSKEIKRINPVYNAVIIRKMVKFLEEKLIQTFIQYFDVENFHPKNDLLDKYKERVLELEFDKKSECIANIDKLLGLRPKELNKNENKKIKPKIKYLDNNNITKIERIFHNIRKYCNSIIHFDPKKEVAFNLDTSIFGDIIIQTETKDPQDNINYITTEIQEKNEHYYVNISTVVDYIVHANLPNEELNKLSEIKNNFDIKFNSIFDLLKKDSSYKKLNSFNHYEKSKEVIMENVEFVENLMEKIKVPQFVKNLKKNEIKNIINYVNNNKYDLEQISIVNCEKKEKDLLVNLNKELNKLDIYSRIKFNLTFERDLKLMELKSELDNTVETVKLTDDLLEKLKALKSEFNQKLNEVQNKVSLINDCLFVFDYSKLFKEINVEEFSKCIKENFKDVTIDLFEEEINNIFLYIYFLKKGIYNEIAYKSIVGKQDDYI